MEPVELTQIRYCSIPLDQARLQPNNINLLLSLTKLASIYFIYHSVVP